MNAGENFKRGGRRCWQAGVGWIQQKTYKHQTSVRTKKRFCILGKKSQMMKKTKKLADFWLLIEEKRILLSEVATVQYFFLYIATQNNPY